MSNIVRLPNAASVEDLWEAYAAYNRRALDNPKLVLDRSFMQGRARAERLWKEAFLRADQ